MDFETKCELMSLRFRGMLAAMFVKSGITPSDEQWKYLSGDREITIAVIGAIAHQTGSELELSFSTLRPPVDLADE